MEGWDAGMISEWGEEQIPPQMGGESRFNTRSRASKREQEELGGEKMEGKENQVGTQMRRMCVKNSCETGA